MRDLLIRYKNGVRYLAVDHRGPCKHEMVLHDVSRERRIPVPDDLDHVSDGKLLKIFERVMG
jgi:hypothetical protein